MKIIIQITIFLFIVFNHPTSLSESSPGTDLEENEGYLLLKVIFNNPFITTESDSGILRIRLEGPETYNIKSINIGENHYLVKLPAGEYKWERVTIWGDKYFTLEDEAFVSKVEPNTISYSADFIIYNKGNGKAKFEYINRSAWAYETIKTHYEDYLNKYPAVYTGYGKDYFFEYLEKMNSLAKNEDRP